MDCRCRIAVLVFLVGAVKMIGHDGETEIGADERTTATAVVLEFAGAIDRVEREVLESKGVRVAEHLGNYRYWALLPVGLSAQNLVEDLEFVQGAELIVASEKISRDLQIGDLPAHSRSGDGRAIVQLEVFEIGMEDIRALVGRYGQSVRFDDERGVWEVEISIGCIEAIAREPVVKRIEPLPESGLLGTLRNDAVDTMASDVAFGWRSR